MRSFFSILKEGGHLVSLRGLPNGRFAKMNQLSYFTKVIFSLVGRKYDRLAAKNHQTYDFIFVHEDGQQLEEFGNMFDQAHPLTTSVDQVYYLEQINEALEQVRNGRSKGKTIIQMTK